MVVNQNLSGTGVDGGLHRGIRYDVQLDPGRKPATLSAQVEVSLQNDASRDNHTYLSIYSPFGLSGPSPGVAATSELGRRAYSASVTIPAQQARTVTLDVEGRITLDAQNWYHLDLPQQASLASGDTEVSLSVPQGWRIAEVRGPMQVVDGRHALAHLSPTSDVGLSVRLERTLWSRLWARLRP
jgi:hypothetical protein